MLTNEWDDVPDDPDPRENLGYEMEELTVIQSETDGKYVFLPEEESHLMEEAFIVVHPDSLAELER